jgi:CDP-2,3-bis-(O-geranylgeranyl)-sn-glycerol synthase
MTELYHVLLYTVPCWCINIALNLWYLLKLRRPALLKYDAPLDLNYTLPDGYRLLGVSTTWVGLPVAILSGMLIESFITNPALGALKGLTVYLGHACGAFIKRRFGIPRGKYVPIIDHGDSIIVTGIIFVALGKEQLPIAAVGLIVTLLVQPILAYAGYLLKLRDNPL